MPKPPIYKPAEAAPAAELAPADSEPPPGLDQPLVKLEPEAKAKIEPGEVPTDPKIKDEDRIKQEITHPVKAAVIPNFNLKNVVKALNESPTAERRAKLIQGLHERFWHAKMDKPGPLLKQAGLPKKFLEEIPDVLKLRIHCNKFQLPARRPMLRTTFAKHFNHMVQTDIFFLFGKAFQLYIDELFKYKSGDMIANKSFDVLYRTFMSSWGRFLDLQLS